MTVDTITPRSRRALLAGTAGALVGLAAGALGRPARVAASDPNDLPLNTIVGTTQPTGVDNATNDSTGLDGTATGPSGVGVFGRADSGYAVRGTAYGSGTGVSGYSTAGGVGVQGESASFVGVFGIGPGDGVRGSCGSATHSGVWGDNTGKGTGVTGSNGSAAGTGVAGVNSGAGRGVLGWSATGTGVVAYAGLDAPAGPSKTGVFGASAAGRGGVFKGKVAQLRLMASGATTHPHSGALGDLFLDKNKRLWLCKGGTAWHQLA